MVSGLSSSVSAHNPLEMVREPQRAAALLHPQRLRLLEAFVQPDSAAGVARRLGLPRQQVSYHVRELETFLEQVSAALRPAGVLYLDEYVGPSRHEWNKRLLAAADAVYGALPKVVRRHRQLQVDWQDPSEAVRSSEIVPLVEAGFSVRERRDYGGNLLSVIHPHLRLDGLQPQQREELLGDLLAREEELLLAIEESTGVWVDEGLLTPEILESSVTLAACVHGLIEAA